MAVTVRSTDNFFWSAKDKTFRQEISSLDLKRHEDFYHGVTLKNPKTGGIEHFTFVNRVFDKEELSAWEFISDKHNLKMTIWND